MCFITERQYPYFSPVDCSQVATDSIYNCSHIVFMELIVSNELLSYPIIVQKTISLEEIIQGNASTLSFFAENLLTSQFQQCCLPIFVVKSNHCA